MTRYRLTAHPDKGTFSSATEAVAFALLNGLNPAWEAIS